MEELTYEEKFIIEKLKEHEGKIKYEKLIKVCENKFWGMRLILKKLKEKGYIEDIPTPISKRSKGYKLTPSGIAFTDRIFSRFDNLIEVAIQSKLKICASCGVKLYEDFHIETIHGKELNFCYLRK